MKNWIFAVLAGAAIAVSGPAQAERMLTNWVDVAQKPKLLTNDMLMHKQLCATNNSDSSCTETESSEKLLLANGPTDGPTFVTPTAAVVPEPGSWITLAIGGLALVAFGRKRRS